MFQSIAKLQLLMDTSQGLVMFNVFIKDYGNDTKHIQRKITLYRGEAVDTLRGRGCHSEGHCQNGEVVLQKMKDKVLMKDRVLDLNVALAMVWLTR